MATDFSGGYEEKKGIWLFLHNIRKYLFGVLVGVVAAFIMLCVFSLVLTLNAVPDALVSVFAYFAVAVGAFAAGFAALRLIRTGGLVNGLITGTMMFFLQFFLSLAFSSGKVFSLQTLIYLLINCLLSALGGIAGVNMKRRFHK